MNSTATSIYLLVIALWIPGCKTTESSSNKIASHVFGDQTTFDAFRTTFDVTVERLHCKKPGICISTNLADYRRYLPRSLSQAQIAQLRGLFGQPASYPDDLWRLGPGQVELKACGTTYGVLFTFHAKPMVRIALCFNCDEFGVFVGDSEHSQYVNRGTDFGPMRPALVALVESVYPNDPGIQSLPLKRP